MKEKLQMTKNHRIARRIVAGVMTTVRGLLGMDLSVDVQDEQRTWMCQFDGKAELTPDGVARWSVDGILDLPVTVRGNEATVHGLDTDRKEKAVCALFNTIAGNVNDSTYAKYVASDK